MLSSTKWQPSNPFPENTKTIVVTKQFKEEIKYDDILIKSQKEPAEYFLQYTRREQIQSKIKTPLKKIEKIFSNVDASAVTNPDQKVEYHACASGNFLGAFWMAYNKHGTITISPDDIWIWILKGFSKHINLNAEQLRNKFVDFKGQELLEVVIKDYDFNLEQALNAFEIAINQKAKPGVAKLFKSNFSTTGIVENLIQQVAVMEIFEKFFLYSCWGGCGIQKVSFLGKLEDWLQLKEKIKELKQFDCEWWINELEPIINEFIKTYNNDVNYEFWDQIFSYQGAKESGQPASIGGWFMAFYPYFQKQQNYWFQDKSTKVPIQDFTENTFVVPIKFSQPGGVLDQDYVLLAGFSGIYESENNFRPQLSAAFGIPEQKKDNQ